MILGVVMELIYQAMVLRAFRPVQLALVVLGLAILPYLVIRGPVTRIARLWIGPRLEGKTP